MSVVRRFPSSSSPGTVYTVSRAEDGSLSCDCSGWIYCRKAIRECKHTKEVGHASPVAVKGEPVSAPPSPHDATTDESRAGWIRPMLATPIEDRTLESFEDGNWWLEEKFDGHRVIVAIRLNGSVAAWSRPRAGKTDGLPRTLPPHILEVLRFFPPMTIDAELVMPGGNSWNVVDTERQHELELIIFDVLQVDGRDVTGETASTRREYVDALQVGLREAGAALVRASKAWLPRAHYDRAGNTMVGFKLPTFRELVADIWRGGGEGAILKRKDGLYRPGYRSQDWIKVKRLESATMLIVGFQQGLLGPYSVTLIHDDTNGVTSSVKTKDNDTMRLIAENPEAFIGRRLRIEHQGMFKGPKGLKPRHPMWDHLID